MLFTQATRLVVIPFRASTLFLINLGFVWSLFTCNVVVGRYFWSHLHVINVGGTSSWLMPYMASLGRLHELYFSVPFYPPPNTRIFVLLHVHPCYFYLCPLRPALFSYWARNLQEHASQEVFFQFYHNVSQKYSHSFCFPGNIKWIHIREKDYSSTVRPNNINKKLLW